MVIKAVAGVLVVAMGLVAGCGGPFNDRAHQIRPLVDLAAQRMLLADAVAADKRATGAPIEDPVREAAVIDAAAARGQQLGLDQAVVRLVVGDQIRASKAVQQGLMQRWSAGNATVPDVADTAQVRGTIDVLTEVLLVELDRSGSVREEPTCNETLNLARRSVERDRDMDQLHSDAFGLALASICRR